MITFSALLHLLFIPNKNGILCEQICIFCPHFERLFFCFTSSGSLYGAVQMFSSPVMVGLGSTGRQCVCVCVCVCVYTHTE